jgi:hypothetical protein
MNDREFVFGSTHCLLRGYAQVSIGGTDHAYCVFPYVIESDGIRAVGDKTAVMRACQYMEERFGKLASPPELKGARGYEKSPPLKDEP